MNGIKLAIVLLIICSIGLNYIHATTYQYDNLNRLSKVTYDDGTQVVYTYDASGNRSEKIITVSADMNIDTNVDFEDFARFALHWLETDCVYPELCGEADFDWSGDVGISDLSLLVDHWLYQNTMPSSAILNASVIGGNGSIRPVYGEYEQGTIVSLTSTPDSGYQVKQWTGMDDDLTRELTNTVTMSSDKTVSVKFESLYVLNSSVIGSNGTIEPVYGEYEHGTVVNLTATPDVNYKIRQWTGTDDDSSKSTANTTTMDQSNSVSVEFEEMVWPDNSGFEYGNLSAWTASTIGAASVGITDGLTEGNYSALLVASLRGGDGTASLERSVSLQTTENYTFSFDYKCECLESEDIATVQLNGISYDLICDDSIKTFSQELQSINSITIVFYAEALSSGRVRMQIDNCNITP